jgi:stalled ribosome rescue protein Dom34
MDHSIKSQKRSEYLLAQIEDTEEELFLVRKSSCKTYEQFCCKDSKAKKQRKISIENYFNNTAIKVKKNKTFFIIHKTL